MSHKIDMYKLTNKTKAEMVTRWSIYLSSYK